MEFVRDDEVYPVLKESGVARREIAPDRLSLRLEKSGEIVRYLLRAPDSAVADEEGGAQVIERPTAELAAMISRLIRRLHMDQVLLVPVSRWANVLDAVAYSMASDENWQEFDAMATVERNTRDPVLCVPADFHMLDGLIAAQMKDAESPEQGLTVVAAAAPVILELVPGGGVRVEVAGGALADEAALVFGV